MLRISRLTDYAMIVMSYLALDPTKIASAVDLASSLHLSAPTVSKLLKILLKSGLVKSFRGTGGGYQLARPADTITLAHVVTAIEGELAMVECCKQTSSCRLDTLCSIKENWQWINKIIMSTLSQYRLSDMAFPFHDAPLPATLSGIPVAVQEN